VGVLSLQGAVEELERMESNLNIIDKRGNISKLFFYN